MRKKITIAACVAMMLVGLPAAGFGQAEHPTRQEVRDMTAARVKLDEFYRILTTSYLDTIGYGRLVDKGIVSMLSELDPHSAYLTADEMREAQQSFSGSFSGIGVEFNVLNDTITVINTIPGGPAESVGVMPNDRIVGIDGRNAVGMKRTDVPNYLRGERDSKVGITVFRRGAPEPLDFTITRGDIPLHTVDAAYKPDNRTGYIKVNRFAGNTMSEFAEAFVGFGRIDGLILDLRGNGGGLLPQALYMSEFFLNKGDVIVSTEGNLEPTRVMRATRNGAYNKGRLIVLIDENSASGSEIVAGAVKDWDRGILIGRPTFGKGLVQRQFDMSDGSGLRITIARYLTPSGRAIQRPYELGHKEDYYAEHYKRYGSLPDSIDTSGPVYHTLKSHRAVYGGGGIRPDIAVPIDTLGYSDYWAKLLRAGMINEFVQNYLDANRPALVQKYPTFEQYEADTTLSTALVEGLTAYAASRGIPVDDEGLATSGEWLCIQLKGLVAQRLWGPTEYYRIVNPSYDPVFKKATTVMQRWYDLDTETVSEKLLRELTKD
ncbi:MAG: PDZ domain-containing protein [Rikenellaceae bacterium]|jgi:carboxyl-terminal processing protease|nr:PDZ domain-containing protein [Rikenellaceae bacterium]